MAETDTREDQLREYREDWERLTTERDDVAHSIAFLSVICGSDLSRPELVEYPDNYRRLYHEAEAAWTRYYTLAQELRAY